MQRSSVHLWKGRTPREDEPCEELARAFFHFSKFLTFPSSRVMSYSWYCESGPFFTESHYYEIQDLFSDTMSSVTVSLCRNQQRMLPWAFPWGSP